MADFNELTFKYSEAEYTGVADNYLNLEVDGSAFDESNCITYNNFGYLLGSTYEIGTVACISGDTTKYIRLSYNRAKIDNEYKINDIYAYEVAADGTVMIDINSSFKVCRMFSVLPLEETKTYTINVSEGSGKLYLSDGANNWESEGDLSSFGIFSKVGIAENAAALEGFINGTDEVDGSSDVQDSGEGEGENGVSESAPSINDVINSESGSDEVVVGVGTPDPAPAENNGDTSKSLAYLLIATAVLAVIFAAIAAAMFAMLKKEKKRSSNLESENSSRVDFDRRENESSIAELERKLRDSQNDLEFTNKQLEDSKKNMMLLRDKVDELEKALAAKPSGDSQSEAAKLKMEIKSLGLQIDSKDRKIKELSEQLNNALTAKKAEEKAAPEPAIDNAKPKNDSIEEIARCISLSSDTAAHFANEYKYPIKYMEINVSITGDVVLREIDLYKKAPIICIGALIFLNPDFYRSLPLRAETYDNMLRVKDVFEIKGLSGNRYAQYGLESITPTEIESFNDGYVIKRKGEIVLAVND